MRDQHRVRTLPALPARTATAPGDMPLVHRHAAARRRVANAVAAAFALVLAAACASTAPISLTSEGPAAASSPSPSPEASPLYRDPYDLAVGECFDPIDETDGDTMLAARMRDCDEPHLAEVIGVVAHRAGPDDEFPGVNRLHREAEDACYAEFGAYVGIPYDISTLDGNFLLPSEETWLGGDRRIMCYVLASASARFTESVRDSRE